jgi:acyl-CoA synthetase (AMP-forming)/AMP-acid ligase II
VSAIIIEQSSREGAEILSRVWRRPETFAFLPARSPVDTAWVGKVLRELPEHLRRDHFVLQTSGSTGRPKLVIGARSRAERLTRVLHSAQDNEVAARTVVALPLSYSFAFVNQWVWATVHDRELVPTTGLRDPSEFRGVLAGARDAMLCLVGVQGALMAAAFEGEVFDGVTRLHFAGGRFPQSQLPTLRRMFPYAEITNNYGCAEAMPRLTVRAADAHEHGANVGRPLPGIELRADDAQRLYFRSIYAAVAVCEDGRLREVGDDDWIPSGDLSEQEDDGSWRLLGRTGEIFKRHGEKVSTLQLLETVGQVWRAQAATYRDRDRSGEPGYVLVLAPTPDRARVRALMGAIRRRHTRAQWPLRVEGRDALPRLANGKVDASALATQERSVLWDQRM